MLFLIFIIKDYTDTDEGSYDYPPFLKHDSGSYRDDNSYGGLSAPPEILARGPRAQQAYAEAAKAGKKKVFRTRLMLVGQERVGKTSLKEKLLQDKGNLFIIPLFLYILFYLSLCLYCSLFICLCIIYFFHSVEKKKIQL